MNEITYTAIFHPQVWSNDHAIAGDPIGPCEWDVTAYLLRLPEQQRKDCIQAVAGATDVLRDDPAVPAWIRDWSGPFLITLEQRVERDRFVGSTHFVVDVRDEVGQRLTADAERQDGPRFWTVRADTFQVALIKARALEKQHYPKQ
jgi:hypothetical protein